MKTLYHRDDLKERLKTYQVHTANSAFSQEWAERRWSRSVNWRVWYPPVQLVSPGPVLRDPARILTVGRVCKEKHPLELIQWFRELYNVSRQATLKIAGSSSPGPGSHENSLRAISGVLPVEFITNSAIDQLHDLYRSCGIFWHMMGWGVAAETPERCEHFGMTTVEAMSAGCVPVVYGRGGQVEIVEHGVSGFVWHTGEELIRYTVRLIEDEHLRKEMSLAAQKKAELYTRAVFDRKLVEAVSALPPRKEGMTAESISSAAPEVSIPSK